MSPSASATLRLHAPTVAFLHISSTCPRHAARPPHRAQDLVRVFEAALMLPDVAHDALLEPWFSPMRRSASSRPSEIQLVLRGERRRAAAAEV